MTTRADAEVPFAGEAWRLVADFARFAGRRLRMTVALMIAAGFLEGVGLALLLPILTLIAPGGGGTWQAAVVSGFARLGLNGRTQQIGSALLAFCALIVLRAVVLTARDRLISDLTLGYVDHRRVGVVSDIAHARWSSLTRLRHARIGHILSSEIGRLDLACWSILQTLSAGTVFAVQAVLMVALSPVVAGLALLFALVGLAALAPLSRRAVDVGRTLSNFHFRMAGEAAHFLGGLKIAVAHDMSDAFVARVVADTAAVRSERDRQQRFQSRVSVASASIASAVGAGMIFGAVALDVSTVTLVAGLAILMRMNGPVRILQTNVQQFFGVLPAFTALTALEVEIGGTGTATACAVRTAPRGTIRFERVGFGYPGSSTPVFGCLDLAIGRGEMIGLSGPSGSGKTTFVDLLVGLLEPASGRIVLGDEVETTSLGPAVMADWRSRLAYVAQDSYLINDSVRANLNWNQSGRSDAEMLLALKTVGAEEIVAAMPEGLDTMVDERGTRLSGGERQRIALARAMLRAPELLILDEATNAIDVATEREVLSDLRRALPNATILVIAHRDETLAACDRVIVLNDGEDGTVPASRLTGIEGAPAGRLALAETSAAAGSQP